MPKRKPTIDAGDVYVTRQVHFNAGHRLFNPARSRAWNERVYGPCAHVNGHGHNYVLEVTVRGRPDPETGYVIDLSRLKAILEKTVLGPCVLLLCLLSEFQKLVPVHLRVRLELMLVRLEPFLRPLAGSACGGRLLENPIRCSSLGDSPLSCANQLPQGAATGRASYGSAENSPDLEERHALRRHRHVFGPA